MTYDDAIAFWFGRINYEVKAARPQDLKLERMAALLHRLGDPHAKLNIVHVTGTKGKGSVSAMVDAILRAAGYRTGLFTSPHLTRVEERIRVNDVPIPKETVAGLMAEVAPAVRAVEAETGAGLSFFEIGTALGFLHFAREKVDFAVIEVGLGGRFDATNVVTPLVSVITSIGLDHTQQLGTTEEEIAYQKAGIIKPGVPVVSGVTSPGPRDVIEQVAAAVGAPLDRLGRDFWFAATPAVVVPPGPRTSNSSAWPRSCTASATRTPNSTSSTSPVPRARGPSRPCSTRSFAPRGTARASSPRPTSPASRNGSG